MSQSPFIILYILSFISRTNILIVQMSPVRFIAVCNFQHFCYFACSIIFVINFFFLSLRRSFTVYIEPWRLLYQTFQSCVNCLQFSVLKIFIFLTFFDLSSFPLPSGVCSATNFEITLASFLLI